LNAAGVIIFNTILSRFGEQGEKTGWTYILLPEDIVQKLKPGNRKSFRVSGLLDKYPLKQVALIPMGDGSFIMPINANMRKAIGKRKGAMVKLSVEADEKPLELNRDLMECLEDDPEAKAFFFSLPPSHRNYFSKWVEVIKSPQGREGRIADVVNAMTRKLSFPEMLRSRKTLRGEK